MDHTVWGPMLAVRIFAAALTRKTFEAAVRLSPTAPDLREMSIIRGFVPLFFSINGFWNFAMTSCRYIHLSVGPCNESALTCLAFMEPSKRQKFIPSSFNFAPTRSRKDVNCENTKVLSPWSNSWRYLTSSLIFAEWDFGGVTSWSDSKKSSTSGGRATSEARVIECRQNGQI